MQVQRWSDVFFLHGVSRAFPGYTIFFYAVKRRFLNINAWLTIDTWLQCTISVKSAGAYFDSIMCWICSASVVLGSCANRTSLSISWIHVPFNIWLLHVYFPIPGYLSCIKQKVDSQGVQENPTYDYVIVAILMWWFIHIGLTSDVSICVKCW